MGHSAFAGDDSGDSRPDDGKNRAHASRLSIPAKIPKLRPCRKQPPKPPPNPSVKARPVKAARQGRPRLSGRRFLLHFPRLSRAAAAEPQVRRAAGQCRARLLQHAVEAAARHAAGQPADASRHHLRQVGSHLPQQALSRLQGAPAAGAGRSDPAIRADPRGGARVRPALPRAGRLRGRRSDRDLCPRGLRARRHRHHRLLRQGPDAARDRLRRRCTTP